MLDVLFNAEKAERHPFEMFLIGFFYSSISIFLSLWIFKEHASLIMIFLTLIPCIYVIQGALRIEEGKEDKGVSEKKLLREHSKIILFFFVLFLGFVVSFCLWTIVLPFDTVQNLFSLQNSIVQGIRGVTGEATSGTDFTLILYNNLKVLFISLLFAFFYGAGAIFILTWNASVIGFVIGDLARGTLGLLSLPVAFTKYFLHGIPEVVAYLVVALAGGLIYTAVIQGDSGRAKRIFIDVVVLIIIAIVLLVVAALIEVYISPLI